MVFLPNLSVNLRACLCGVVNYASAQALDFLDLGQKSSFLDWKHQKVSIIVTAIDGWALFHFTENRAGNGIFLDFLGAFV